MTRKFRNDYTVDETVQPDGRVSQSVTYNGRYYQLAIKKQELAQIKRKLIFLFAAMLILHVFYGFIPHEAGNSVFSGIPYAAAFFPILYAGMAILRIPKEAEHLQRFQVEDSFPVIKTAMIVFAVILSIAFVAEIVFLALKLTRNRVFFINDAIPFLSFLPELVISVQIFRILKQVSWKPEII